MKRVYNQMDIYIKFDVIRIAIVESLTSEKYKSWYKNRHPEIDINEHLISLEALIYEEFN